MNKEYIKELFEEEKEVFIHHGLDIETPEDLEDFMESIIISNMQFEFDISPNADKLFNRVKENTKELSNEDHDIEKMIFFTLSVY